MGRRVAPPLDVGCGTGVVSMLLAELGHDVAGVDFAPEMLDGRPPREFEVFAREGLRDVEYESLMDPELWGREPHYEYYAVAGTVRGDHPSN